MKALLSKVSSFGTLLYPSCHNFSCMFVCLFIYLFIQRMGATETPLQKPNN